jgi:hypothetical protein
MFPLLSPAVATYIHNFFTKNKLMRIIFYEKFIYVHIFFIYVHKFVTKDNLYTYFSLQMTYVHNFFSNAELRA